MAVGGARMGEPGSGAETQLSYTCDNNDYHCDLHLNCTKNGPCKILQGHDENMSIFVRIKINVLVNFIPSELHN